jgi:CRISPR-associated endonuclease Csn1
LLPERIRKRAIGKWRRGKTISVAELIAGVPDQERHEIEVAIRKRLDRENTKKPKHDEVMTRDQLMGAALRIERLDGRAPYHRGVLREAVADVMERGIHPTEEGGCLFRSEAIRNAQLQRAIDEQTNNHLVRHRLLILDRLHGDIVTIEVNRDLKEMSGKTAKQVAQDIGQRLANFKSVSGRLEKALAGKEVRITPGLIRKARIAEDLGWRCPYTGKGFDEFDLLYRKVDKDHIIPRSQRPSDGLDSLVITFNEVNRLKGKRTALRFVEDEQGKTVEGMPSLTIKTLTGYVKDVNSLETFKGHDDDKRRKKNRKRMLLVRDFVEKEFIPADLTQTSQLVRLGAQGLQKQYLGAVKPPVITSLPGSVTGAVRKSWDLLGCLSAANPQVLDSATGEVRTKTEIRDITHMHHALDACVLAFASLFLPGRGRDGEGWKLLIKRRLNPDEQARAREMFKNYVEFEKDGTLHLIDLPGPFKEQIRRRLAERRVVQHIPAEMVGLPAQLNAWRVERVDEDRVWLRQSVRQPDGSRKKSVKDVDLNKVIGLNPGDGNGKLKAIRGALILDQNYGIAILDRAEPAALQEGKSKLQTPAPVVEMVPYRKVWHRLQELREANKGYLPKIIRSGQSIELPRGTHLGFWRIFSVKNNADGLAVSLGEIDALHRRNDKQNVRVLTLLRDGMRIAESSLCGIDASLTKSMGGLTSLPVENPEGSSSLAGQRASI